MVRIVRWPARWAAGVVLLLAPAAAAAGCGSESSSTDTGTSVTGTAPRGSAIATLPAAGSTVPHGTTPRPTFPFADGFSEKDTRISIPARSAFRFDLKKSPNGEWDAEYDERMIDLVEKASAGTGGAQVFQFDALAPGSATLTFTYHGSTFNGLVTPLTVEVTIR